MHGCARIISVFQPRNGINTGTKSRKFLKHHTCKRGIEFVKPYCREDRGWSFIASRSPNNIITPARRHTLAVRDERYGILHGAVCGGPSP